MTRTYGAESKRTKARAASYRRLLAKGYRQRCWEVIVFGCYRCQPEENKCRDARERREPPQHLNKRPRRFEAVEASAVPELIRQLWQLVDAAVRDSDYLNNRRGMATKPRALQMDAVEKLNGCA